MNKVTPLAAARGPERPYPAATLTYLICGQAERRPDAVAVRQWDQQLTYRELVDRAAGAAAALRGYGVGPGDRVGVCASRDPDLVVTALGVLLAGAAYVPLDPDGPPARQREIIREAGVRVVIGDVATARFGDVPGLTTVGLPGPAPLAPNPAGYRDEAYVLFTSGSTGRPKGVPILHQGLVAFVTGFAAYTGVDADTRSLASAALGFDAAVIDLWVPLAHGGSVQLVGTEDRLDARRLQRFAAAHEVNWGLLTPTVLALLDPVALPGWRTVLCGAEAVPAELVRRWAPGRRFINTYGPTEATVAVTVAFLTGDEPDPVPIGWALPNCVLYVVDADLRPVPAGEPGELLIDSPGLSTGYLGRPELTATAFVPDPFSGWHGKRLYRTGDLVRTDAEGRLIHLGRLDRQVKVRGQRVELGEVEAVLAETPGVDQAAVEAVDGPTGTELVAFLTPADAPDDERILAFVRERLTPAMRPARLVRLAALPVSPASGKLDRAALRQQAMARRAEPDRDPGTGDPVATAVARCWARLLGSTPTPATGFLAAGGNSVAAMRLAAALRADLDRQVDVRDVVAARTFADLVDTVRAAAPAEADGLTTGNPPTLSVPQRRFWFAGQNATSGAPYNIALAQRLHGPLDIAALGAALRAVAQRQDVLRWRIRQTAGEPYAVCAEPADVPVAVVDLTGDPAAEARLRAMLTAGAEHSFDLATGPSWQATVYRLGQREHVLAITAHHAVFDGWSEQVLYADLSAAYAQAVAGQVPSLPPLAVTYADYAVWRAERDRRRGPADLAWWTARLRDAPTLLDLPRDRPRPAVWSHRGAEATVTLDAEADAAVRTLAAARGSTTTAVLLAGFGVLLARITGGDDHVLGAVVADRRLAGLDDLVGFLIDTVPVRVRTTGPVDFAGLVDRCGTELYEATAHGGVPLDRIAEALGVTRDTAHAPLVQVLFNVLNFAPPRLALPGVTATPVRLDKPGSPFDLIVYVVEHDARFGIEVGYNPDLFDADRIDALVADLADLVGALAAAPHTPVDEVAMDLPRPAVRTPGPVR